jgi:ribosomal protein S18 acetylase RimI-like enzyme
MQTISVISSNLPLSASPQNEKEMYVERKENAQVSNPTTMADVDFAKSWDIYERSFPDDERRSFSGLCSALKDPNFRFDYHKDFYGNVNGIMASWVLGENDFKYIEHIAVDSTQRSQGVGSSILRPVLLEGTPVVLEVEPAELNEDAARRIRFYERLGFHVNEYTYYQPPYDESKSPLLLKVLSFPNPLTPEEFINFKELVYAQVYKVEPDSDYSPNKVNKVPPE